MLLKEATEGTQVQIDNVRILLKEHQLYETKRTPSDGAKVTSYQTKKKSRANEHIGETNVLAVQEVFLSRNTFCWKYH